MKNAIQLFNEKYGEATSANLLLNELGEFVICNSIFESIFECDKSEISTKAVLDFWYDQQSVDRFNLVFQEYKSSSKAYQLWYKHTLTAKTKSGFLVSVNFTLEHILTEEGDFFVLTVFKETTSEFEFKNLNLVISGLESKNQALKLSEQEFELAQVVGNMGHWRLDYSSNDLIWSKHIYTIFELNPNKFKGTYEAFIEMVHPDDRAQVDAAFTNHIQNKEVYNIEHRLLMPDGRIKWVHERCTTSYNSKNEPLESIGIVQDITERKHFEEQAMNLVSRIRTYSFLNSHKLRVPVSNILGLGDLLEVLTDEGDIKNCVKHIVESTKALDNELREISILLSPNEE